MMRTKPDNHLSAGRRGSFAWREDDSRVRRAGRSTARAASPSGVGTQLPGARGCV